MIDVDEICKRLEFENNDVNKRNMIAMKDQMGNVCMDRIRDILFPEGDGSVISVSTKTRSELEAVGSTPSKTPLRNPKKRAIREFEFAKRYRAIFLPYLDGHHWVLFVIFPNHNLVARLDSMGGSIGREDIRKYLSKHHVGSEYEIVDHDMLKQRDATSCGYMTLVHESIFRDKLTDRGDEIDGLSTADLKRWIASNVVLDSSASGQHLAYTKDIYETLLNSLPVRKTSHVPTLGSRSGSELGSRSRSRSGSGSPERSRSGLGSPAARSRTRSPAPSPKNRMKEEDAFRSVKSVLACDVIKPLEGASDPARSHPRLSDAILQALQLWLLSRGIPMTIRLKEGDSRRSSDHARALAILKKFTDLENRTVSCIVFRDGGEFTILNPEQTSHDLPYPKSVFVVVHLSSSGREPWRPVLFRDAREGKIDLCPVLDLFDLFFVKRLDGSQLRKLSPDKIKEGKQMHKFSLSKGTEPLLENLGKLFSKFDPNELLLTTVL